MSKCDGKVSFDEGFGYNKPGCGVKGKQRWLLSENVLDMCTLHDGKKDCKWPHPLDESDEGSLQKRSRYNKWINERGCGN